jgi:hypothetical protein
MDRSRTRWRAVLAAAALGAVGCSSASDRVLSIDSYPPGASVRFYADGRSAGQTPLEKLHVNVPSGQSLVLLVEKENYQTVAYPVEAASPDHLFFCLQKAPDPLPLINALSELQKNVTSIRETVEAMRDAEKKGGN